MDDIRALGPDTPRWGVDCVRLLDEAFAVQRGSFIDDFPIWDPSLSRREVCQLGYFSQNQLLSTAGIRLAALKLAEDCFVKVGVVGAVATHPLHRGRGYSKQLILHLIAWARQHQVNWVFLWSSETTFYQKLGFNGYGQQLRLPLREVSWPRLGNVSPAKTHFNGDIYSGWNPGIFSLMQKRKSGFFLRDEDRVWIEKHRNVQWFYVGGEMPTAYLGLGRGIDLKDCIHEWGGDDRDLVHLLRYVSCIRPESCLLGTPDMLAQFGVTSDSGSLESLCLARELSALTFFLDGELTKRDPSIPQGDSLENLSFWIWGLDGA